MNDSMDKSLLSMLLAIRELDSPLNSEEKDSLYVVAQQLSLRPTAWETDIQPNLMEIINGNPSLNTVFQDIKSNLEKIDNIPEDLLPTAEDLAAVIPAKNQPQERPLPNINREDLKRKGITNMYIQIISSPEPSKIVKKISKFEQLLNFIRQNWFDSSKSVRE